MRSKAEAGNDCDTHTDSCVSDTGAKSDKNRDFMLIAENNAALSNGLHERNGCDVEHQHFHVSAPLAASHHIATRSATGRLAKRPRKDLSPSRSPPRKIGTGIFCFGDFSSAFLFICIIFFYFYNKK